MQRGMMLMALAATTVSAEEFETIAQKVNSVQSGWKAERPTRFNGTDGVRTLCGAWLRDHPKYVHLPAGKIERKPLSANPTDFDARTQWSNCSVISHVRDQSSCGSCWAFGSTETFEDRRCIHQGIDKLMSTEDTASCCHGFACGFSMGCNGGQPGAALEWMTKTGVVTGGDYQDKNSCRPYTLAPCAHHVPATSKYPACPTSEYPTPSCSESCSPNYGGQYEADKVKGAKAYSVSGEEDIVTALQSGPLSAAFQVYSDFPTYKSGVYKHTTGSYLGGHAVEIVGYGVEAGQKYWTVKNSWNEMWGDGGFFKIARGVNECGIEASISAIDF